MYHRMKEEEKKKKDHQKILLYILIINAIILGLIVFMAIVMAQVLFVMPNVNKIVNTIQIYENDIGGSPNFEEYISKVVQLIDKLCILFSCTNEIKNIEI